MPGPAPKELPAPTATRQTRNRPDSSRHASKCRICNHPDRHAIEFDFLNWRNPGDIVQAYRFRDLTTIYRHAHATGLFAKRRLNLRFALERIVERVNEVPVTATSVIRAARALTRINDSGEWVDPPSRLIVTHINTEEVGDPAPHRPRRSKRNGGQQGVRPSPATSHSPLATVFAPVLLDEPSDSAGSAGELPRIDGKPAPPEIILELSPEFARCREERARALEADRQANAASRGGGFTPPASAPVGTALALPVEDPERSRRAAVPSPMPQEEQSVASPTSSLPQAAFPNSASSALPHPVRSDNNVADNNQNVAMPSSLLPQAAPDKPAARRIGSSGSADPPFPFTPEPLRRWKPRRRF